MFCWLCSLQSDTAEPEASTFFPQICASFTNACAYITHNATQTLSDIPDGNLSYHMQLPLVPQKHLYYFLSHMQ